MKRYESPRLDLVRYNISDVLSTSGEHQESTSVPFIQEGEGIDD